MQCSLIFNCGKLLIEMSLKISRVSHVKNYKASLIFSVWAELFSADTLQSPYFGATFAWGSFELLEEVSPTQNESIFGAREVLPVLILDITVYHSLFPISRNNVIVCCRFFSHKLLFGIKLCYQSFRSSIPMSEFVVITFLKYPDIKLPSMSESKFVIGVLYSVSLRHPSLQNMSSLWCYMRLNHNKFSVEYIPPSHMQNICLFNLDKYQLFYVQLFGFSRFLSSYILMHI